MARIEAALRRVLEPEWLELEDESHRHRGHPGAAGGGSHFRLTLVSPSFAGRSRLDRHRMVYDALREELGAAIHAVSIRALTPEEWRQVAG
ncbi:MAG: BolA family protein [Myxococcota bacterium]